MRHICIKPQKVAYSSGIVRYYEDTICVLFILCVVCVVGTQNKMFEGESSGNKFVIYILIELRTFTAMKKDAIIELFLLIYYRIPK